MSKVVHASPDSPKSRAREKILAAALELFSVNGFEGTTTRDIAARAGTNLGLIKYYFGNKDALWKAVIDSAYEELRVSMGPVMSADVEDAEQIADVIRTAVRFVGRKPAFVRLMNDEGKRKGPRMRWLVDRHGRWLFEASTTFLNRARKKGLVPDVDPIHLHYMFFGSLGLIFSQAPECRRLTGNDPTVGKASIEAHAEAMVALFVR